MNMFSSISLIIMMFKESAHAFIRACTHSCQGAVYHKSSAELENFGHICIKCDREHHLLFQRVGEVGRELTSNDVGSNVYLSAETEERQRRSTEQTKLSDGEHAPPSESIKISNFTGQGRITNDLAVHSQNQNTPLAPIKLHQTLINWNKEGKYSSTDAFFLLSDKSFNSSLITEYTLTFDG